MSKPYREADLSDQLDLDLAWRLRELSNLKQAIRSVKPGARTVLLRALVTMLYAHWEGFIRICAQKYFEFLTIKRLKFRELDRQLYINNFLVRLDALYLNKIGVEERCRIISDVLDFQDNRFSRINIKLVDTKSNLNFNAIKEICIVCGVSYSEFEDKSIFIDKILVKRRNEIAHGEEVYVKDEEVDELIDDGIRLMRVFKNAIENKIYEKAYLTTVLNSL